jgi:hypothetical protein
MLGLLVDDVPLTAFVLYKPPDASRLAAVEAGTDRT